MSKINNLLREDYENEKNKLHSERLRAFHIQIKETEHETLKNNYITFLTKENLTYEEQEGARLFLQFLLNN